MNIDLPTQTHPFSEEHAWCKADDLEYYFWTQAVVPEVQLHKQLEPVVKELGNGSVLTVFKGLSKQEILYTLKFKIPPKRFVIQPYPHTMFWSYGVTGGASTMVKYLYRDRNLSIHAWLDKNSFLADLRNVHYNVADYTFWSR